MSLLSRCCSRGEYKNCGVYKQGVAEKGIHNSYPLTKSHYKSARKKHTFATRIIDFWHQRIALSIPPFLYQSMQHTHGNMQAEINEVFFIKTYHITILVRPKNWINSKFSLKKLLNFTSFQGNILYSFMYLKIFLPRYCAPYFFSFVFSFGLLLLSVFLPARGCHL